MSDAAIPNGLISLQTSKYAEFVMNSHPVFKLNDTVSPHVVPPWVGPLMAVNCNCFVTIFSGR